jgi:hypothetical protein
MPFPISQFSSRIFLCAIETDFDRLNDEIKFFAVERSLNCYHWSEMGCDSSSTLLIQFGISFSSEFAHLQLDLFTLLPLFL